MAEIVVSLIGGNCPVQAEGTINGKEFYFRARGQRWRIGIGGDVVGDPDWSYSEPYGESQYDAGWMDERVALEMIKLAAERYDEFESSALVDDH